MKEHLERLKKTPFLNKLPTKMFLTE